MAPAVVSLAAVAVVAWPATGPRSHVPAALQQPLDAKVAIVETQLDQWYYTDGTFTLRDRFHRLAY